jgi:hypothetical protein
MAKSVEEDKVLLHIGDIKADHAYMGRAEDYPQIDRNILHCQSGMSISAVRICTTRSAIAHAVENTSPRACEVSAQMVQGQYFASHTSALLSF